MKIAVLLGGQSGEHEVSLVSGLAIARALKKNHEILTVGISKAGSWHLLPPELSQLNAEQARQLKVENSSVPQNPLELFEKHKIELIFPALHGPFGEDGTLQGFLEILQLPYVGCGVLASSLAMDKDMAKKIFETEDIPVVPWICLKKSQDFSIENIIQNIEKSFGFPVFVKPANMGSSVGVSKVKAPQELEPALKKAFEYDRKILIEQGLIVRELEIALLGNHSPRCSEVGEIRPLHEFYSYEAKYLDENGAELFVKANDLKEEEIIKIKELAVKAFQAIEARGLARVDFFLEKKSRKIFINEINTMPGFTPISMYPKLWQAQGLEFSDLCQNLIDLALEEYREKNLF